MSCQIWWFLHKYILRNLREHPDFHKKNHICIWIQHSLLAETLWNKYAESHFLVFLVFFFFLGSLQGFVSPKAPAAYVTPSPRILRSPSRCLAYHLATLYFLCWCCTLFYACLTLSESLLLASILALTLTVSPTFSMTACFVEAPPLKCKAAEEAANCTLLLWCHLCLGHLFHTRELMDSLTFWVWPGKHLARRAESVSLS